MEKKKKKRNFDLPIGVAFLKSFSLSGFIREMKPLKLEDKLLPHGLIHGLLNKKRYFGSY